MQLDFFLDETSLLREEVQKQKSALDNVRRGLFARHNEMGKELLKIRQELEKIKSYINYKESYPEVIDLMQNIDIKVM